jgi:hypothetical protein
LEELGASILKAKDSAAHMYRLYDIPQLVFWQKLMEDGIQANNSGVKPIQDTARLPAKLKHFSFMEVKLLEANSYLFITQTEMGFYLQVLCKSHKFSSSVSKWEEKT